MWVEMSVPVAVAQSTATTAVAIFVKEATGRFFVEFAADRTLPE
jgi:hypothetical protein